MEAFELASLIAECSQSGQAYLEFIRHPSLSVGLYMLPTGATDTQEPHTEDEIYYVINGSATMQVDAENQPVKAGSTIFVAANVEHRFHTITEGMTILVIFAPAEYTNSRAQ